MFHLSKRDRKTVLVWNDGTVWKEGYDSSKERIWKATTIALQLVSSVWKVEHKHVAPASTILS